MACPCLRFSSLHNPEFYLLILLWRLWSFTPSTTKLDAQNGLEQTLLTSLLYWNLCLLPEMLHFVVNFKNVRISAGKEFHQRGWLQHLICLHLAITHWLLSWALSMLCAKSTGCELGTVSLGVLLKPPTFQESRVANQYFGHRGVLKTPPCARNNQFGGKAPVKDPRRCFLAVDVWLQL